MNYWFTIDQDDSMIVYDPFSHIILKGKYQYNRDEDIQYLLTDEETIIIKTDGRYAYLPIEREEDGKYYKMVIQFNGGNNTVLTVSDNK